MSDIEGLNSASQSASSFEICRGNAASQTWVENFHEIEAKLHEDDGPSQEGDNEDNGHDAQAHPPVGATNGAPYNCGGSDDDDGTIVSKFLIRVDNCFVEGGILPERSYLRIFFKKHSARVGAVLKSWLSMGFEQVFKVESNILQYEFKVEATLSNDPHTIPFPPGIAFEANKIVLPDGTDKPQQVLKEKVIQLPDRTPNAASLVGRQPPPQLVLTTVTVTPVIISPRCNRRHQDNKLNQDQDHPIPNEEKAQLCLDLKDMFLAHENYPDLQLTTKDGVTLTAHQFIVAGRCPVLGGMIELDGGSGKMIYLPDVSAGIMSVILKWIYTAELEEVAEIVCLEEVIKAADKFKLSGLLKMLDKKVISVCNPDNAIRLGQICCRWRNVMPTGFADVSKFLRDDMGIPPESE